MTDTILTEPIIPDFGDTKPAKASASATPTAAAHGAPTPAPALSPRAEASETPPRKFVVICSKGNLDMAYPGLVLANAALGEGIETHIFFTFWGFDIITERYMDDLQHTMVGNTAMHLPQAPGLRLPAVMGVLPGMNKMATSMMKKSLDELEIPGIREMLDIIVAAGGHLWGCKMSFDMNKLDENDLYEGVEAIISATDFIELSEGGQIVFI
ncbi:MAG: DsrE/DsrF/DrsH-like family protein [Actinomycetes bacterium]